MIERPDFLNQSKELKERDREVLGKLKEQAIERQVVPTKDNLKLDFINRSTEETKRNLKQTDNEGRKGLKGRLKFLREERAKLLS